MNKIGIILAVGLLALAGCLSRAVEPQVRYVDTFDLSGGVCARGRVPQANQSVDQHPLTVAGKTYPRGLGLNAEGAVGFLANGRALEFDAWVGVDDDAIDAGFKGGYGKPCAQFKVWADGKVVWSSGMRLMGQEPVPVHVDLAGAREIVLETASCGSWKPVEKSNGDWLEARFTLGRGTKLQALQDARRTRQLGLLTPPEKPEPQFNGADIWGVHPGHEIIFRVPVTGERPLKLTAAGLPAGVTFDSAKGVLRGIAPAQTGNYDIVVTAENAKGRATRTIRLAVGDTLALTPPMGWNSWNTLCYRLTQRDVLAAAQALDESGLADHGWAYVNLDDWWAMNNVTNNRLHRIEKRQAELGHEDVMGPARDARGKILPNRSFPDMKALTAAIHARGLKAGIYSSPGPTTCGKCEGSYGHEAEDAASWADWGFDYVKYDWCSYDEIFSAATGLKSWSDRQGWDDPAIRPEYLKPYARIHECLQRQSRDIVLSCCLYGMAHAEEWVRAQGGNCWRSFGDLKDAWVWMEESITSRIDGAYWKYSGPGCWADPDMLNVGRQYSFGGDHPTFLTPNEQYTQMSLWSMVGAPLLIGCDLTKLDPFTRNLLANDEVLAVSQDRLGKVARRLHQSDAESVWARPLVDGSLAVALVNRYPFELELEVSLAELGLAGECEVRDLWRQRDEGKYSGKYVAKVPAHATKLVRLQAVDCPKCD